MILFDKASEFAPAFADQRDDVHIRARELGHHAEQRALAHAAASEDTDALTFAAGEDGIDCADSGSQRFGYVLARKRILGRSMQRILILAVERAQAVDRISQTIQNATEKPRSHFDSCGLVSREDSRAQFDALKFSKRH